MTTINRRKSDILTDDDYNNQHPCRLDEVQAFNILQEFGDQYDYGVLEAAQNVFDSADNPETDVNPIYFRIPKPGDEDYGIVLFEVRDNGGGITNRYGGQLVAFLDALKATSEKAKLSDNMGANGVGMIGYFNIGQTIIIISQDKALIHRFAFYKDEQGRPTYGNAKSYPITPENQEKFGIYGPGTIARWYDKREGAEDLDPDIATKKIQERFGWRLMEFPNIQPHMDDKKIEPPKYLTTGTPKHMDNLTRIRIVKKDGETILADPKLVGWTIGEGKGQAIVHVNGYHICDIDIALKKATAIISIVMPEGNRVLNPDRTDIRHRGLKQEIIEKITREFIKKKYADLTVEKEQKRTDRDSKKIHQTIDRMLAPVKRMLRIAGQTGTAYTARTSSQDLPAKTLQRGKLHPEEIDETTPGYAVRKPGVKKPVIQVECNRCHHFKIYVGDCKCKCHKKRVRDDTHVRYVGVDGVDDVMREAVEEAKRKQYERDPGWIYGDIKDGRLFIWYAPTQTLVINRMNPLFRPIFGSIERLGERIAPYIANVYMDIEKPNAYKELDLDAYRELQEAYTLKALGTI